MSVFGKVWNFVRGTAVKVADVFVRVFGPEAAQEFGQGVMALLKTSKGVLVLDVVRAVQALSMDGDQKRAEAFRQIAADFKSQGLMVADSVINMLIELAVQYLKGNVA